MPINARFQADFASFYDAVQRADVELATFQDGAAKAETSLAKMANSLNGTKIVSDATLAAEAVNRVGGAGMLTEKELARVSATAAEAAAKLTAMGKDVPPQIAALAAEAKHSESALGAVKEMAWSVGSALAAAFTVRAVAGFVSDAMEAAHNLEILGLQTQINVQDLQILTAAMNEFGVDGDQLARGIYQLSRRIAGGDESASAALHMMGMSLDDVRGKNGMELFLTIERGLGKLQGSLRDTASADLYGARLGASMAAASTGIDEAIDRARRLNTLMSDEAVKAAADYEHAINRAKLSLGAMAVTMVGPVAEGFNVVAEATQNGAGLWNIAWAMTKDFAASNFVTGASVSNLATLLDEQNRKTAKDIELKAPQIASTKELGQAASFMAALQLDALKTVTPEQQHYLEQLKEMGALNAQNAAAIGVGAAQFKNYTTEVEAAAKAEKERQKALDDFDKYNARLAESLSMLWNEYDALRVAHGGSAFEAQAAQVDRWAKDTLARLDKMGLYNAATAEAVEAVWKEKLDGVGISWGELARYSQQSLKDTVSAADATYEYVSAHSSEYSRDFIEQKREELRAAIGASEGWAQSFVEAGEVVQGASADTTDAVIRDCARLNDILKGFISGWYDLAGRAVTSVSFDRFTAEQYATAAAEMGITADELRRMVSEGYVNSQASTYTPSGDRTVDMGLQYLANLYARVKAGDPDAIAQWIAMGGSVPGRASGGDVEAGRPYMIGEGGPELFVPSQSGSILSGGGAGMVVHNVFNIVDTEANIVRRVSAAITRSVLQGQKIGLA